VKLSSSRTLLCEGSPTPVEASVAYNANTKTARLDPSKDLKPNTLYEAVVTAGAKDLAGNRLDQKPGVKGNQRKVWCFTTAE
jgi:Big-like domain-containing protein